MTLTILIKTLMKNLIKTQTKILSKKTPTKSLRKIPTKTLRKKTPTKILRKNLKKILVMILLMSLMKKVTSM